MRNESSLEVPPPEESSGYKTTIVIAAVLVLLFVAVIAIMSTHNGSKTAVSSGSKDRRQEDAGSLARSRTDSDDARTSMRANELPRSRTAASAMKKTTPKNVSRTRRTESPRSQAAPRGKQVSTPASAMRESKQTAPAKVRTKGDPFANLRDHLSTGAKSE